MGIILVVGAMLYSIGMCVLFERVGNRSPGARHARHVEARGMRGVLIPDRVPPEWVDAYRAEQDG